MENYLKGKSVIVTGAGGGFGRMAAEKASALGALLTCVDINSDSVEETVSLISKNNGTARAVRADVTLYEDMQKMAKETIQVYGGIDIILNNAGIMPLAFYADHGRAMSRWHSCIDVNIKGVVNGIACVYDHMIEREQGHVLNMSSIFGNYPVAGSNVYGATKAAVNFLSESLRVEAHGIIKVTVLRPTGVLGTGLTGSIINPDAAIGITGHNSQSHKGLMKQLQEGTVDVARKDPDQSKYINLDPAYVADQIIYAMNQPRGVSVGDITIRATGDHYIL